MKIKIYINTQKICKNKKQEWMKLNKKLLTFEAMDYETVGLNFRLVL